MICSAANPRNARQAGAATLQLIHGTADEVVSVDDARLLYHAATEPKNWLNRGRIMFSAHMDIVWQTFFTWLQRLSPPGKS